MSPFLSMRPLEQIKCGAGVMNLPICLVSVGIGLGYADAGPTHYSTEDFACSRAIVGSSIYTPADVLSTQLIAKEMLKNNKFSSKSLPFWQKFVLFKVVVNKCVFVQSNCHEQICSARFWSTKNKWIIWREKWTKHLTEQT